MDTLQTSTFLLSHSSVLEDAREAFEFCGNFRRYKFKIAKSSKFIAKFIIYILYIYIYIYIIYIKEKKDPKKSILQKQFKQYRNILSCILRDSKDNYFKNFFIEHKNNIKLAWKGIKSIINTKPIKETMPTTMTINKENIGDPNRIANAFNEFFSTIAEKTKSKIINTNKSFSDYLINPNNRSLFLKPTTTTEIGNIILSLNENKATGPASIPTTILQIIAPSISSMLSKTINLCFQTGTFPNCLKISNIIPIHKKDSKLIIENYRPISLLSNISKIFEKTIHKRLYNFIEDSNCLYNLQFGFRTNHNTNHALIQLTEEIRTAIDNGQYASGIFVDLQKAFDTVEHNILLNKLNHYGIRGIVNNLFKSYLTNRYQYVTINGVKSKQTIIVHGVPQGSVLGPLLFLIYINDLHQAILHSKVFHFADDTSLINKNSSLKKLNKQTNWDLNHLCIWLQANKISLNTKKTEIILFRSKQKQNIKKHLNFRLSGQKLNLTSKVKYLGVILDEHLSFDSHIKGILPKLNRANGMLAKIRHFVSKNTLLNIYYAIFNSHLTYSSQIWGQMCSELRLKLSKAQNKALRIINFKSQREPHNLLYANTRILKLEDQIKLMNCTLAFKHHKKLLPSAFDKFLKPVQEIHTHNTKLSHLKLVIEGTNTVRYGTYSIITRTSSAWNDVLPKIKTNLEKLSKNQFKNEISAYILSEYNSDT